MADATAIIGLLVGFLVVGIIGTYIGDQMISATNLTEAHSQVSVVYENVSTPVGTYSWEAPTGVTSIDFHIVGGGGGGGAAGTTVGGNSGAAAAVNTKTGIAVTPGTSYLIYLGAGGSATNPGTNSNISIGGTVYDSAGGAAGTGFNATKNGSAAKAGYVGTLTGAAAISGGAATGNASNNSYGGALAYGYGTSGGGAGFEGSPGTGVRGAIQISYTTYTDETLRLEGQSQLVDSRDSIVETFALGVLLCKIIIIVSIASIVFVLLQKTGLIPRFGQE